MPETKRDKFRRLAIARVNKAAKMLELIGNLSGDNYESDPNEVFNIFDYLERKLAAAKAKFESGSNKTKKFKLNERDENIQICSLSVDVQLQPNDKYDVYIADEGCSGSHYTDITSDDIGRIVADEIECYTEAIDQ